MSASMNDISLKMHRRNSDAAAFGRAFLLVLFGVFAVIMLVALFVGLQGYRAIAEERNATDAQRLAYGSLANTVKAFDAVDAFSVNEYEGNDVLSMVQRTSGGTYLMLLYVHDGMLMQQYSVAAGAEIAPGSAHPLFATETFRVSYENDVLTIMTDEASPSVYLRTPQWFLAHKLDQRASAESEAGDAS